MVKSYFGAKPSATAWNILWLVAGFSLVYYAWMMVDLVLHPFSTGSNPIIVPYLFRWLSAVCGTFTVVVALFILRRVAGNVIGLLLVIFGVGAAGWSQRVDFGSVSATNTALIVFNLYFFFLAFPALSALLFFFPNGQVYPVRYTNLAWVLILLQGVTGTLAILSVPAFQDGSITNPIFVPILQPVAYLMNTLMVLVAAPAAIFSMVLRYRASGVRERLQIKWLAWLAGLAIGLSTSYAAIFPEVIHEGTGKIVQQWLRVLIFLYWQLFPAAGIGIALLRYRLWDIDVIIRRTLLYTALTGLFGFLYFGSVVVLRQLLSFVTGESTLAIVLSTLLIAALFEPARRRVQTFIDRRFYRAKYDAALALDEFSSAARQEVELSPLTTQLVGVVEKTVQPEKVWVWLKAGKRDLR